jgi:pimeloyl-ACP methyl ester carboxylesterase
VQSVEVNGLRIGYREMGAGPGVLLIHGWPTSSYLWRNVMAPIAERNRVVAIDLPGFGGSDKPVGAGYGFGFHGDAIDGLLELDIGQVALAGHDLGGPIAIHWALHNRGRVTALALANTLVYPEFSDAVREFVTACATPELRERLTSRKGLEEVMRLGLTDDADLPPETLGAVLQPFGSPHARQALAEAGIGLEFEGFQQIAAALPGLDVPMRIVYGADDPILPDVAETVARIRRDLPHAECTVLPGCGPFLQEEAPDQLGTLLADFFAREGTS